MVSTFYLLTMSSGMWYSILNFVNLIGVISNGFLIAFTSGWAQQYSLSTRLWICLGFEVIIYTKIFMYSTLLSMVYT